MYNLVFTTIQKYNACTRVINEHNIVYKMKLSYVNKKFTERSLRYIHIDPINLLLKHTKKKFRSWSAPFRNLYATRLRSQT